MRQQCKWCVEIQSKSLRVTYSLRDIIFWLLSEFICNPDANGLTYSKLLTLAFSELKILEQFLFLTILSWDSHYVWKMI